MILHLVIVICLQVSFQARSVPFYNQDPNYENVKSLQNEQRNVGWTRLFLSRNPTKQGTDGNVDPKDRKHIPTIEGQPIYLPEILKFDRNDKTLFKQYAKTSRPWHYFENSSLPKYGYIDSKIPQYGNLNERNTTPRSSNVLDPEFEFGTGSTPFEQGFNIIKPLPKEKPNIKEEYIPFYPDYSQKDERIAQNFDYYDSETEDYDSHLDYLTIKDNEKLHNKNSGSYEKSHSYNPNLNEHVNIRTNTNNFEDEAGYDSKGKMANNGSSKSKEPQNSSKGQTKPNKSQKEPVYSNQDAKNGNLKSKPQNSSKKGQTKPNKPQKESVYISENVKNGISKSKEEPQNKGQRTKPNKPQKERPVYGNQDYESYAMDVPVPNEKIETKSQKTGLGTEKPKKSPHGYTETSKSKHYVQEHSKATGHLLNESNQTEPKNFLGLPQTNEVPETPKCDSCLETATEGSNESVNIDLDHESMKNEFLSTIDMKFRSLVFNPTAQQHEKFQSCETPLNESGSCRYVQHCLLPSIISAMDQFMNYVCIIEDRYIGVCCPEFPVTSIKVKWESNAPEVSAQNFTTNSTTETPEDCGISTKTRIVGGSKADPKEYPWMAALQTMSTGQFFCGGAVINSRYVLTAAHCTFNVPRNQILVRLGEYDFSEHENSTGEDYPVLEIKRHGQYSRRTLRNDIALLKLARPIHFNGNIKTICLPQNKSFDGINATLAGWGNVKGGGPSSDVLLEATFPVLENKNCSEEHGLPVADEAICTMATPKDKGACNGDSGGPLMVLDEETKHWFVIGVVSWGRRGCDPRFPTVYARVSHYLDWIKTHAV